MKHPNIYSEQPRLTIVPYFVPEDEYESYFNPSGYSIQIKFWKMCFILLIIALVIYKYK